MNEVKDQAPGAFDDELPFFVTGRLAAERRAAIEAAASHDLDLARRIALAREERGAVLAIHQEIAAPLDRAEAALMAALARESGAPKPAVFEPKPGLLARLGAWLGALQPAALGAGACALAAVVLAQGLLLGIEPRAQKRGYETASHEAGAARASGPAILVSFAPDARMADVEAALKNARLVIAEGPRGAGLYKLRLADPLAKEEDVARALAALKEKQGVVAFAAPAP